MHSFIQWTLVMKTSVTPEHQDCWKSIEDQVATMGDLAERVSLYQDGVDGHAFNLWFVWSRFDYFVPYYMPLMI